MEYCGDVVCGWGRDQRQGSEGMLDIWSEFVHTGLCCSFSVDMEAFLHFLAAFTLYSLATFFFAITLEPLYMELSRKMHLRQEIRNAAMDGKSAPLFHALHAKKAGTPTGGGVLIWVSVLMTIVLSRFFAYIGVVDQSLLQRTEVYLPLFTLVVMGGLGLIDDFWNSIKSSAIKGMRAGPKFLFLTLFASMAAWWFVYKLDYTEFTIPGIGVLEIGAFGAFVVFVFVIVATANAVNFSDGLDGLAGGLSIAAYAAFATLSAVGGHEFLAIFCGLVTAALAAFLWFNIPPAKFFMGDTGSLSLGATLAVIAMMIDAVFVLPIIGFVFVMEALSVVIQLTSKKLFGKKVFRIAPFHHHLEAIGWPESQIVMRLWLIGALCAVIGILLGVIGMAMNNDIVSLSFVSLR